MKTYFVAFALLASVVAQPVVAEDKVMPLKYVSEAEARIVSEILYTELVRQSFNKGRRFSREQIERGYRRHFEEFKLQLIDKGYVIIVGEIGV